MYVTSIVTWRTHDYYHFDATIYCSLSYFYAYGLYISPQSVYSCLYKMKFQFQFLWNTITDHRQNIELMCMRPDIIKIEYSIHLISKDDWRLLQFSLCFHYYLSYNVFIFWLVIQFNSLAIENNFHRIIVKLRRQCLCCPEEFLFYILFIFCFVVDYTIVSFYFQYEIYVLPNKK